MISFLVAGFVVGALACLVRPGQAVLDPLVTLGLGMTGALVGGLIARSFGTGRVFELDVIGFVLPVVVAVLFIGMAERVTHRRRASTWD